MSLYVHCADVVGYADDGAAICPDCATRKQKRECQPFFAGDEVDTDIVCNNCGDTILEQNLFYEEQSATDVFKNYFKGR